MLKKESSYEDFIRYYSSMEDLSKEIEQLKERNKRVEIDKTRETSTIRKVTIMVLTYAVIVLFLYTAKLPKPWINAIVPTL